MSRFPSRRVAGKKHIWIACRLDATGKVDARASDDPLFVIGTGETSNEREGGAKEKNCRQRQRLLPLLTLLLLKGKNRQRKRRRRRSVFLRPAAAAPWQSHRSHTEKPNLSSLFLASRATRGPTDAGGRTDGARCPSLPPSLSPSLSPSPSPPSVSQEARGMSYLVTAAAARRPRRPARCCRPSPQTSRGLRTFGIRGCVNSRELYGGLTIYNVAVVVEWRIRVMWKQRITEQ